MPDPAATIAVKLLGALVASGVAAWFRKSARWAFQTVSGTFAGYVSGPWLVDFIGWEQTTDYLLFACSITGVMGYSILEAALSLDLKKLARWYAERKTGVEAAEKP